MVYVVPQSRASVSPIVQNKCENDMAKASVELAISSQSMIIQ